MNATKIAYYISTALLTLLMLFSAGMYFFQYPQVADTFGQLGFPVWIIYPLAIAKILGLVAIWSDYSKALKEWAYAGFFYNFVLAWAAHFYAGDGVVGFALPAIVILIISYITYKKLPAEE